MTPKITLPPTMDVSLQMNLLVARKSVIVTLGALGVGFIGFT